MTKTKKTQWTIARWGFNPSLYCDHCRSTRKVLSLVDDSLKERRWVCAEHAQDYKIVGRWTKTWQKDFPWTDNYS